jgi:beta-1,4-galactosyltransferase 1
METVERLLEGQNITDGGQWSPQHCRSTRNIAIIIPYKNRKQHLTYFLLNTHPLLARQQANYKIYVVEPSENTQFNRGMLFNIGFIESNVDSNNQWSCHSYHDVDLLSQDDRTLYACYDKPIHIAHRINLNNYK